MPARSTPAASRIQVLHIVGQEGPRTVSPRKFIRFIYNRLILENAPVRAAAVQALAQCVQRTIGWIARCMFMFILMLSSSPL